MEPNENRSPPFVIGVREGTGDWPQGLSKTDRFWLIDVDCVSGVLHCTTIVHVDDGALRKIHRGTGYWTIHLFVSGGERRRSRSVPWG